MGMVKMKHINIYGPKGSPRAVLEILAREGCFHADHIAEKINATGGGVENLYDPLFVQTIGVLKDLHADTVLYPYDGGGGFTYKESRPFVENIAQQIAQRGLKRTEAEAKLATYAQTKTQLYHLSNLHTSVDEIFSCKYLKVRFGRLPEDSYIKLPFYADKPFTFNEYDFDGKYYWGVYFVPETSAEEVDDIFASLYFERMWVPDFVHGTPQDALAQLMTQESDVQKELDELNNMDDIADAATIQKLQKTASWLNYETQIFDMQKYVITLEHSYYISGYVPADRMSALHKALEITPGVKVAEDDAPHHVDDSDLPPVKLKNNWFARPFEMFVEMYGLPGYGDLDPTSFVAVTYAILFGVMFGDVGQGVLLGLIGYFIMYKKLKLDIGLVLTRCSAFSVLFGFLYGSFFGFEHALDGFWRMLGFAQKPLEVLSPESTNFILLASIGAGIFIIAAAIVTGILSNFIRGIYAKTIFSVNGLAGLVFYVSIILSLLPMLLGRAIPFVDTPIFFVICLVIPFISIFFAEPICKLIAHEKIDEGFGEIFTNGFFDMFDALLSFASNTMSFLRVGGFVLAHAGMMSVVFTLAGMTSSVPVYWLIIVIGNIFVMALEGLFVAIQVLRLEFYEVFSRFFEATGEPFSPLTIRLDTSADK
ncbi:MAG: V-type ATPase 116kDa subunit family protein [Ruthenibacterium sp.]